MAAGLPIKIVALLDVSKTADAIISDGTVTDIKGLKGKQVAYEEGTTSDILLNYALGQNGMTIADIQKVPMPAADAGAALIAGKVPVAVTYEPYLTLADAAEPEGQDDLHRRRGSGPDHRRLRRARGVPEREAGPDRGPAQGLGRGARRLPRRIRPAAARSSPRPSAPSRRSSPPPSTASSTTRWPRTRRELAGDFATKIFPDVQGRRAQGRDPARRMSTSTRRSTAASWMPPRR